MSYPDPSDTNPYAPPVGAIEEYNAGLEPESLYSGYASFGRRFVAFFADSLIVAVVSWVALVVLMLLATTLMSDGSPDALEGDGPASVIFGLSTLLSQLAAYVVYYAGMESSKLQATPGKLAMGLRVTDLHGQRISFTRAVGRLAGKIPSAVIFYMGFLMAAFTEKHQAMHDLMAGTLVVKLR